jgi:hypothetical protein
MADQEHKEEQEHREEQEPLPAADLRPLKELAKEYPLSYHSLRHYAKIGRLRAVKFGNQWATTRAAIEEYLATRDVESIPKKYRREG